MKRLLLSLLLFLFLVLAGTAQVKIGTAVNFTVTDIHGQEHTLFDYLDDGKYVLLDFSFTTCGSCIKAMPILNEAYRKFGCNKGDIVFLGIDWNNSDAEVLAFEEKYGGYYPAVSGKDGAGNSVVLAYGVSYYSTIAVIAPNRTFITKDIWPVTQASLGRIIQTMSGISENPCIPTNIHYPVKNNIQLTLFPNPVINSATLEISLARSMNVTVNIINILGQKVETPLDTVLHEPVSKFVEFENLKPGLYLIQLIADGKVVSTQRFSKIAP